MDDQGKATSLEERRPAGRPEPVRGPHQNIARAALALDALAKSGDRGLRLTDVSRQTGLSKTVTHRCLAGLLAHGLASYDESSNVFFLGDRILAWTRMAGQRYALVERIDPYLQEIAERSEDTAYFSVRRGDESVCYGRAEGSFPIKTLTLSVGDRRPLGIGSGSMAILAFLDDGEIARVMRTGRGARAAYPVSEALLGKLLRETQRVGFAQMENYFSAGMRGVGVPVRAPSGVAKAAFSLAAISERMLPPRTDELVTLLRASSERLTREMPELLAAL